MKSKKVAMLLVVIILAVIVLGFIVANKWKKDGEMPQTGYFPSMGITFDKYKVSIQSVKPGHVSGGTDFQTIYVSDTYIRKNYKFRYNVIIGVDGIEESVNIQYPNYDAMRDINVFDKNFKYEEISDEEIVLVYKCDNNFYITINLKDRSDCFGLDGNYIIDENDNILMLEKYDFLEFIKENEEFNNVLNIEINKN